MSDVLMSKINRCLRMYNITDTIQYVVVLQYKYDTHENCSLFPFQYFRNMACNISHAYILCTGLC